MQQGTWHTASSLSIQEILNNSSTIIFIALVMSEPLDPVLSQLNLVQILRCLFMIRFNDDIPYALGLPSGLLHLGYSIKII
jgi:hypothetical protein